MRVGLTDGDRGRADLNLTLTLPLSLKNLLKSLGKFGTSHFLDLLVIYFEDPGIKYNTLDSLEYQ